MDAGNGSSVRRLGLSSSWGEQEVSGWNVLVYLPRSLYIVFVVQRLRVDCQFQISGRLEKTDIFYLAFQGFDELVVLTRYTIYFRPSLRYF